MTDNMKQFLESISKDQDFIEKFNKELLINNFYFCGLMT